MSALNFVICRGCAKMRH